MLVFCLTKVPVVQNTQGFHPHPHLAPDLEPSQDFIINFASKDQNNISIWVKLKILW